MNIKAKVAIFLLALFISLFEFNAIASCCCCGTIDLLQVGKRAGYEIIANVIAVEPDLVVKTMN